MAGDWGIEPDRLLSFTLRELYEYAKGVKKRRGLEENRIRKFAYLFASAYRDEKKALPPIESFWPIPYLDQITAQPEMTKEQYQEIKQKLIQLWQPSQN